ncbi:MAG: two-component system sensor kinase FixL [Pseudohongiellaceae bacterium]|jgi:two-component system sensor kinase FixL
MKEIVSKDKFTALLDAAEDGIFIIDVNGIVQRANQAVETMLGYEQAELIDHNIKNFMPSQYSEHHDNYLAEHLRTGEKKIIGIGRDVQAQRKDGSIVQIHLTVEKYDDGNAIHFVGNVKDLSALNKSEASLERAEDEIYDLVNRLAHVSRISVMGEMAANIAHEIGQPLAAISTYAQACTRLLDSESTQTGEIVSALKKINDQSLRAADIISGMRNWIREKDIERKPFDCNVLIAEIVSIANPEAKSRNTELILYLEPDLPMVVCDAVQIQQVALNLIKNAIEAIIEPSATTDLLHKVLIKTERKGQGRVQVSVTDFGPGISNELRDNLFNPFFSTKESGMGMGLSICQTIVRAHGGELDFKNNPQGGASFYCVLPTSVESV